LFAFEALLDKYFIKDVSDIMEHLEQIIDTMTVDDHHDYVRTPYVMVASDVFDPTLLHIWANPNEILKLPKRSS
jgi:hypothetical protein